MTFSPAFNRSFSPTFDRRNAGGVWWNLFGAIPNANCIAAYQPKGAADYATSKVNLANPGTYNAADGAAYPSWNTATGWSFLGSSSQYLSTGGLLGTLPGTMICRIANESSGAEAYCCGAYATLSIMFALSPRHTAANKQLYAFGKYVIVTGSDIASGVLAVNSTTGYLNGSPVGSIAAGGSTTLRQILIGAMNINVGIAPAYYLTGDVIAMAVYNIDLSDAQVASLTTAMNAL